MFAGRKGLNRLFLALALGLTLTAFGPAKAQSLPKASYQYRAMMLKEGRQIWGPNANIALFAAQFHQESGWNNDAKSYVGAKGLGQFMPATGIEVHNRYSELKSLPMYSPLWSIRALYLYDRQLYNSIKPIKARFLYPCTHYAMMLSAYNGGLGWLNRDRRLTLAAGKNPDAWWGGVEFYSGRAKWAIKENRDYPNRILLRHLPTYLGHGYPGVNVCPTKQNPPAQPLLRLNP